MIREINVSKVKEKIKELLIKANFDIGADKIVSFDALTKEDDNPILKDLLDNYTIAKTNQIAICQDTGMVIVFLKIGQDVHLVGGSLTDSINAAIKEVYLDYFLRKSIVNDPLFDRVNSRDNTPAIIHTEIVEGDSIEVMVMPKGFGSENMSRVKMFSPSADSNEVIDFIVETVKEGAVNACPPIYLGIGIGGTLDYVTILAKKGLLKRDKHLDSKYSKMEAEIFKRVNDLNIGPGGFGGKNTCLAVNIVDFPTHISGLPVCVSISCHANRHCEGII